MALYVIRGRMDLEGDSDFEAHQGIPAARVSLTTSSSEESDIKVDSNPIIPLWNSDSSDKDTDTESDESDEDEVQEIAGRPHGPIRRARSFNRHGQRDNPIRERLVDQMTVRQYNRSAGSYVHPTSCCKRKRCYLSISKETICKLRVRVWNDLSMDPPRQKTEIMRLWGEVLHVNNQPCCIKFLCNAFGISKTYVYGDSRNDRSKIRISVKTEAAIAFFNQLRQENDKMPNKQEYQLYAPKRKCVWEWYNNQVGDIVPISKSFFFELWRIYAPDLKLRKYLKFTICKECKDLKEVR